MYQKMHYFTKEKINTVIRLSLYWMTVILLLWLIIDKIYELIYMKSEAKYPIIYNAQLVDHILFSMFSILCCWYLIIDIPKKKLFNNKSNVIKILYIIFLILITISSFIYICLPIYIYIYSITKLPLIMQNNTEYINVIFSYIASVIICMLHFVTFFSLIKSIIYPKIAKEWSLLTEK